MQFVIKRRPNGRWGIRLDGLGSGADAIDLKVGYERLRDAKGHVACVTSEITVAVEEDIAQVREQLETPARAE